MNGARNAVRAMGEVELLGPVHDCVQVASTLDRVRDSKDSGGPVLAVDVGAFVAAIKSGRFDQ